MKYRGILLDIDNTLYSYKETHKFALEKVILFMKENFFLTEDEIISAYIKANKLVKIELGHTGASHNRLLYFQKMLEILEINPLSYALVLYELYWDNFLTFMKPFDGVYEFLEKYKNRICLVTDLTAHIQYRKIKVLKLDDYISMMVSSEEAGREKPHAYMFLSALQKMNLQPNEVCMIGDSFTKDIVGASNLEIDSIWLNREKKIEALNKGLVTEVVSFKEINLLI